jgi:hypothetical protein
LILIYFLASSQLDRPKIDPIALPLRPRQVAHSFLPLSHHDHVFLVDCCVLFIVSRPQRPRSVLFFIFYFFVASCRPKQREIVPQYVPPRSHLVITPLHITDAVFWLVFVCLFIVWWFSGVAVAIAAAASIAAAAAIAFAAAITAALTLLPLSPPSLTRLSPRRRIDDTNSLNAVIADCRHRRGHRRHRCRRRCIRCSHRCRHRVTIAAASETTQFSSALQKIPG